MPKDEFDFDDPMELTGVALFTDEDTTDAMCECFVEEFMMMGYDHTRIFALFRHPHYIGMNMVLQNRGEQFVRNRIAEIFAVWGRQVTWPAQPAAKTPAPPPAPAPNAFAVTSCSCGSATPCGSAPEPSPEPQPIAIDPTGSPAPTYNL
jgi:hypothetical protein